MSYCWFYASRKVSLNFLVSVSHRINFWDGVTCRVGSVIPKTTRSAQEYNGNMYVIEKQMLESEQDLSVSVLCPDVYFIIICVRHMISLNQELVNCWETNLVTLLYRCNSMCCGGSSDQWQRSKLCSPSNCNTIGRTHKKLKNYNTVGQQGLSTAFTRSFVFQSQCQWQPGNCPTNIWWAS